MSNEIWAHCENGHEWIVAKLPMEAIAAARQMQRNARCPHCFEKGMLGHAPPRPKQERPPPPPVPPCFAALGLNPNEQIITRGMVIEAYRRAATNAHPNAEAVKALVKHRDDALKLLGDSEGSA